MGPRRWLLALLLACLSVSAQPAAAQRTSPASAAAFVDALARQALAVLGSPGCTLDEREVKVRALLRQNFDLKLIGRFVMGKAWKRATAGQRAEYQRLFGEYLLRTYSRRLGGYAG